MTQILSIITVALSILSLADAQIHQAQGVFTGEPTSTTALLQTRLTAVPGPALDKADEIPGAQGVACFEWSESVDFSTARRSAWLTASAENDYIVRATIDGLKASTLYHFRVLAGADQASASIGLRGSFKTLPAADDKSAEVAFCMGSCMNYHSFMSGKSNGGGPVTATAEDKRLGYPAFAAMLALKPDFFIGTGDVVYYDKPDNDPATTLPDLRRKWHEQFRFPRLVGFFAVTPAYWSKDDHDFRYNDADLRDGKLPSAPTGIALFREQMPVHAAGDLTSPMYRTHRIHRDVQLWFIEGRDHRSPNSMPDGPGKSLWGPEQREWLQRTLKSSDATWKIIITPTPMVGPDDAGKRDNHANIGGFRHEADEFFTWVQANGIQRLLTFCGDRHWQYHSIHPSGVEEFSCGALNDENSRRGVAPGAKNGSDRQALIRQPYTYPKPSGGFLHVRTARSPDGTPHLHISFHDASGRTLHSVTKTP